MQLVLEAPAGATRTTRGTQHVATWDGATLTWGLLVPLPDDRARWIQRHLRAGLAPGVQLELVADTLDKTATGWPLRIVITRAGGERFRLHAFYAFFEHAAVAVVEAPARALVDAALPLLRAGKPHWDAGIASLAQLWDIPVGASPPGPDDALADSSADSALTHHLAGLAHARAGRPLDAIAAWERAAGLDPLYLDGLYNAGIAHAGLGDMTAALACWERGLSRAPRDFWFLRKVVQAHNALGAFAASAAARQRLLDVWATSTDPAVQRARSYVFHQSTLDGLEIHGSELLAERDGPPVLFFEPAHAHGQLRLHAEPTTEGGLRFVLQRGDDRTELETLPRRPPFTELIARAHAHLRAATPPARSTPHR